MFSIKNSFANCIECPLFSEPSCILETNVKYLNEVKIIFIAENPGKDEIIQEKPLVGRAGKLFRKYFEKYNIHKEKYLLTNVVLCQTLKPDGTTGNPDINVIEKCKVNCMKLIEECKPELIVLMGTSPVTAFGLLPKGAGVTNLRGEIYKWNNYNVLITLHPSYINRVKSLESTFEEDIKKAASIIGLKTDLIINEKENNLKGKSEPFYYKLPDKYYTSNYKLIDVQYLNKSNEVLYLFRDKDNKKEYYKTNDEFVCYKIKNNDDKAKKVMKYEDLIQVFIKDKDRHQLDASITYEGDVKLTTKHAMDYYIQKKDEEPNLPMNVMFLDIETYTFTKVHSSAHDANDAIAIIRYSYNGIKKSLVLDPKTLKINNQIIDTTNKEIEICKTEIQLLNTFFNDVNKLEPDVMSGWFSNDFDLQYIINRAKKINADLTKMSKFGEVDYNKYQFFPEISGIVCLDMLELYKNFTFGGRESYSLDYIGNLELKKGKTEKGSQFSELYRTDVNRAILYNINDVDLLEELDEKLKHIFFQDELKRICKNSFRGSKSVLGQIDSLLVSFLKEKGYSSKNSEHVEGEERFEGAYVQNPILGIHDYIVDFDFTSLYPSLILTYNIGVNTFVMKLEDYKMGHDLLYNPDNLPNEINVVIDPYHEKKSVTIQKDQLLKKMKDSNLICTINGCFFKNHDTELSFYSEVVEMLLSSRKINKKKMFEASNSKNEEKEKLYNTRQLVYKTLANSLYGGIGNKVFRFFNIDSARSITLGGQEAIKTVIKSSENYVSSKLKDISVIPITKQEMFTDDMKLPLKHVITSDTDSVFITYKSLINKKSDKEDIMKTIMQYNLDCQTFLNKTVISTVIKRHNVSIEKNRLELKNEFVIKRGLYVSSKHYANYLISQEGNPIDKIDVKGLDTRRSDYSSITKKYLNEVLDLILKTEKFTLSKIIDYVKEKDSLFTKVISSGQTIIGRPVSFTKKLEEYKTLSQGVKGMINWNNLEYKFFDVGSRGYLFKLKGIDLDKAPEEVRKNYDLNFLKQGLKLEIIVVPEELDHIPPYYIIDVKSMVSFAWTDRYNLLLEPIITKNQPILTF